MSATDSGKRKSPRAQTTANHAPETDKPDDSPLVVIARGCLRWLERFSEDEVIPDYRKYPLVQQLSDPSPLIGDVSPEIRAILDELHEIKIGSVGTGGRDVEADTVQRIRSLLRAIVAGDATTSRQLPAGTSTEATPSSSVDKQADVLDKLVTLDQVAPLVGKKKRTLERYLSDGKLPEPDFRGGGGKAHKWYWRPRTRQELGDPGHRCSHLKGDGLARFSVDATRAWRRGVRSQTRMTPPGGSYSPSRTTSRRTPRGWPTPSGT